MNDPEPNSVADEASSESPAARLARYAAEPVTAEDIERLMRMAKLGEELAEEAAAESRAKNTPDPVERAQQRRDFDRLVRSMRMTLGLKSRLLFQHNAWQLRKAKAAADEVKQATERTRRTRQRDETLAVARDVIQATQPEHEILKTPGGLGRWYDERDREKPLAGSSLGAVIAGLCKDIAVAPDWRQWQGSWVGDAAAALPFEPPLPEIQMVVVGQVPTEDGGTEWVELGILQPDGTIVPEAAPSPDQASPPAEAGPATEAPAPPAQPPPPLTRLPRNGDPPMTKEQMAAFRRRLDLNPNYQPSPYDPL
jgi:hypothetical protein